MAHTALNDEEIKEYFDTEGILISFTLFLSSFIFFSFYSITDELDKKIKTLADFIRNAKHFIVYTGAGSQSFITKFLY
jgi:hypothetical protein